MDALLTDIQAIVDPSGLIRGEAVGQRINDWLSGAPCRATAIVRPTDTQQLAAVMRCCHAAGQPVVTQGGMTGLVHGGQAGRDELVISLERMTAVETLDPLDGTLTVQAGAPLEIVQQAAASQGWHFPLDLGARGSCTIGGNISTNAGGNRVIRHGMMRQHVLGLEAVLADGTVISSLNRMLKNNAGYDVKQLFIGSEGTLGIVTRAVLRLQRPTTSENTALLAVPGFEALTSILNGLRQRLGANLTACEVMWQSHYRLLTEELGRHTPPLSADSPYYLLVEAQGIDQQHDEQLFSAALKDFFEAGWVSDAVMAHSGAQRQALWAIREDIEGLIQALRPLFAFDVSLPIGSMPGYVETLECELAAVRPGSRLVVFGHIGDGNLHLSINAGSDDADTRQAVERLVYGPLAALGGSVSAEHGIGLEKRDYLALCRSPEEIALMHTLKQALDPKGLLNRHKVLPFIACSRQEEST
ncbi:FAD-binding oxidoreductase [Modicisalibacter luteus]|uniref:FAD-binding oxidoreductase n=1 Tax=Modicisalibacter luteus TaxID=453962 RepID=A0ABV7M0W2_9GAMM|nr:FAD-binding oxidoreductase [Halomonas lutea]GHA96150.1 oxidoreductase [Halomonas lutea]